MGAAKFDILLEERSDLNFVFTYFDELGNPVDVTGYGGTIVFSKSIDDEAFAKGDHNDGWVQFGSVNGEIVLAVPYTAFQNIQFEEGVYQFYIYPNSADITDRPRRLLEGKFKFSKSLL